MAKKSAKRGRTPGVNKKGEVMKALTENPSLSPTEISQRLAKQGLEVGAQYIANIKSEIKKQGGASQPAMKESAGEGAQASRSEQSSGRRSSGKVNKMQAIRDYLSANPDAMPKPAAEALTKKHGVTFAPGVVSTVKYKMSKGEGPAKERGRSGRPPAASRQPSEAGMSVDNLMAAKQLADQLGSVEKARQALDLLAKLVGTSA